MIATENISPARTSIVIGTRGSRLAIWQAEWIQAQLHEIMPDLSVTLRRIKTSGDKILDVPLAAIGGKGLFVKEIEESLLAGEIDLAVHSMKDVPTDLPDGLEILCVPKREDPRDALVSREKLGFEDLPSGARIGTSSLRRQAQLLHKRPDLRIEMLRGNVETRLRKLKSGEFDAIVLAAAGLKRMGWSSEVTQYLPHDISLPAIAQGALGLEGRGDDQFVRVLVSRLEDTQSRSAVTAERALLKRLEGGCQIPIAGHATIMNDWMNIDALVASVTGQTVVRDGIQGPASSAESLGTELAEKLLANGGKVILDKIYGRSE
jgi:hydroxymethylbilane synthase